MSQRTLTHHLDFFTTEYLRRRLFSLDNLLAPYTVTKPVVITQTINPLPREVRV